MSRLARTVLAIATLVVAWSAPAWADEATSPRETAQRLADQSLAESKKAEGVESGWQEIYDRGIDLANQAMALDPAVADAHYALFINLGRKAERTGIGSQMRAISKLKKLLNETIELDPRHAHAWEAKGEMLLRLPRLMGGDAAEGERALRHSAELAPRWPKPPLRLAELDWKNGRVTEARAEAERARDLAREAGDQDYRADAEALLKKMSGP
jgi:tetratricopeptide (TPR) repeat protein